MMILISQERSYNSTRSLISGQKVEVRRNKDEFTSRVERLLLTRPEDLLGAVFSFIRSNKEKYGITVISDFELVSGKNGIPETIEDYTVSIPRALSVAP